MATAKKAAKKAAPKKAAPKKATPEKLYVLNSNPAVNQNSYTIGAAVRQQINKGYWNISLSRNYLDNDLKKFENNLTATTIGC